MSVIVSLTDGVNTIPLRYNPANQHYFKALYGMKISPGEAVPTWHESDGFPPQLVDLYNPNRQAFVEFHVSPTSTTNPANTVQNALALLRRWVDGADQQAARFHILQDVNRVDLMIQREGSTVATYHPVIYGAVDDGDAHYSDAAELNDMAYKAVISLTLAPAGEAENKISLNNRLIGGALDFESSVSGTMAGWTAIATTTNTVATDIFLLNGTCQKCDASTGGGIMSSGVVATSTSGAGYVWVYVVSGSVDIDLYDNAATAVRDSNIIDATDSNNVSDNSYLDFNGHQWWRVPVASAVLTNTNAHRIRARADGGAAVWYMDVAYLEYGRTTVPDCWQSNSTIYNRGDQTTTNPEYRNWIDVWGIPGDVDALINHTITATVTGANGEKFLMAGFKDKAGRLASAFDHYIECEDFSSNTASNGSWADTVVAGTSGGSVARFTATGAGGGSITVSATYVKHPLAVMLRAAASAGSLMTATLSTPATGVSPVISANVVTLDTDYQDYIIGIIQLTPPVDISSTAANLTISITTTLNAQTVSLDRVMLIPVVDGRLTLQTDLFTGAIGSGIELDGINEEAHGTAYRVPELGTFAAATAGQSVTRFYYNRYDAVSTNTHYLDDTFSIVMEVLPRTRHLLGTI